MPEEFRRILIPTDGSKYNELAIQKGLGLAKLLHSKVTAFYVLDESTLDAVPADSMITNIYDVLEGEGLKVVDKVIDQGEKLGLLVEGKVTRGSPAMEIVEEAKEHDLIIMGTLGRTGLSHFLLGSVAEAVVRHAHCPVMLIRAPGEEPED